MCVDGDVRLMNGLVAALSSGRVEVCYSNSYGAVCSHRWDDRDATVVCNQLGMENTGKSCERVEF